MKININHSLQLLTPKELGALLQKKERTIREMVYRGKIPYLKIGKSTRFRKEEIEEWLEKSCRVVPNPSTQSKGDPSEI